MPSLGKAFPVTPPPPFGVHSAITFTLKMLSLAMVCAKVFHFFFCLITGYDLMDRNKSWCVIRGRWRLIAS